MNAISRTIEITNKRGLHARASAKFVNVAAGLTAKVEVEKDGSRVVGTSIMGLMMLAAGQGTSITVEATGPQAADVIAALAQLVDGRFAEDDEAAQRPRACVIYDIKKSLYLYCLHERRLL